MELFLNRKRENAGSLCIKHGTLSIVSHYITLHHIVSVNSIYIYLLFDSLHIFSAVVLAPFQRFIPILAFYPQFSVLSSCQCFIPISVFYPHFSVASPFQCSIPISVFYPHCVPISVFYPHFNVLSPFQCFIPISVFYPHFSVLSPFQCFILISVFYPHFSVLSPFQCFIPISVSFSVSVSAIQFQRFMPVLPDEIRKCSRGQTRNVHEFYQKFMIPNFLYELTLCKKIDIVFVAYLLNKCGQMTHYTKIMGVYLYSE